jgi:hypothetical protein
MTIEEILGNVGNNVLDNVKLAIEAEGFGVPKAVILPLIALARQWHKSKHQKDWMEYIRAYELVEKKYGAVWTTSAMQKYGHEG